MEPMYNENTSPRVQTQSGNCRRRAKRSPVGCIKLMEVLDRIESTISYVHLSGFDGGFYAFHAALGEPPPLRHLINYPICGYFAAERPSWFCAAWSTLVINQTVTTDWLASPLGGVQLWKRIPQSAVMMTSRPLYNRGFRSGSVEWTRQWNGTTPPAPWRFGVPSIHPSIHPCYLACSCSGCAAVAPAVQWTVSSSWPVFSALGPVPRIDFSLHS